ncbi:MAG TPA: alpha/beta hydrolase-fold protein [Gemmatimonadaceae bacterium]
MLDGQTAPSQPDPPRRPTTLTGAFRFHPAFASRYVTAPHDVIVHLPLGYETGAAARYPVLYMQDGQNLFDAAASFAGEWRMDETSDALAREGVIRQPIIVGVYNAGAYRVDEYTPTRDAARRAGGKALLYGRMLVEELKPFIDDTYRTLPGAADTGLGGSSLGGLVSLYLGLIHPTVFGMLAVLSPSVWWDNRFIVRRIRGLRAKPSSKIWLSTGTAEGDGVVEAARRVRGALLTKGWTLGIDLAYLEVDGAPHNEAAWAGLVAPMLRFLFPRAARAGSP